MSRHLILLLGLMLLAAPAWADAPTGPIPPVSGGWGNDCTNWQTATDPWASGEMIYDYADLGGQGEGWRVCNTGNRVEWPSLDIELWIEMECVFTWDATHFKIHRASNYDPIVLVLNGTSNCNNGNYIITTPPTADPQLGLLRFVKDQLNRGPGYGSDIPMLWDYMVDGSGTWAPMIDLNDGTGSKYFLVGACDHNFQIRITLDQKYHQEDGYYYFGGPGAFTCPAEPL